MELPATRVLGNRAKLLWVAVLLQALRDMEENSLSEDRREAERWLFGWGSERDLKWVCAAAGVKVDRVRAAAREHARSGKRLYRSHA